jgi:AraC-like DNA-binding protein
MTPETNLAQLVNAIAPADGDYATRIPALNIYRRSEVTAPMPCIFGLGLGLAVQGGKRVLLGDQIFDFGPGESIVTSIDVPVVVNVTRATRIEPYLGIRLALDSRTVTQLAAEMDHPPAGRQADSRALSVAPSDAGLLDALCRLLRLLEEPHLVDRIAPLILQEIVVRLLDSAHGPALRHLVAAGSPGLQISRVITWLRQNYTTNFTVNDLALKAHMSLSTFRHHFRSVAGMSPLQYSKLLRLQDARQLMLSEDLDAGSAALRVGYESASQFSREYTRLFGAPPLRDIKRLQESA